MGEQPAPIRLPLLSPFYGASKQAAMRSHDVIMLTVKFSFVVSYDAIESMGRISCDVWCKDDLVVCKR